MSPQDPDEQTKNEAAKWRTLRSAMYQRAVDYEAAREEWHNAKTREAHAAASQRMDRLGHDIAGYVSLLLGVAS